MDIIKILQKKVYITKIATLLVLITSCLLLFIYFVKSEQDFRLVGYHQDESSITLQFSSLSDELSFIKFQNIPSAIDIKSYKNKSHHIDLPKSVLWDIFCHLFSKCNIMIPLEDETIDSEYSIVLFNHNDYVEIVRQSSGFLKEKFLYDRQGGYSLLGRHSIETNGKNYSNNYPIKLYGKPMMNPFGLETTNSLNSVSAFREINFAAHLTRKLYEVNIKQGPSSLDYPEFLKQSFKDKLNLVSSGKFSLQCAGFRDLFLHASESISSLKVRAIGAFNYEPFLPDLIPYSHAAVEIWIEDLDKWVLFDPWNGFYISENGLPVSANRLSGADKTDKLSIVPILTTLSRYTLGGNSTSDTSFSPSKLSLHEYFCNELGCSPPYLEYFNHIHIIEHVVVTAQDG